jgi:phosphatidylethanolamine/phosphatidyl-N-methylethanolamine N-methyltransferase
LCLEEWSGTCARGCRAWTTLPAMFLREFLRHPLRTGAVGPSSRRLAHQMTLGLPEQGTPVVVELGPGTGAFTGVIQERLAGRGRHLAVELNPRFAEHLEARFPDLEVEVGDAADLPRLQERRGVDGVDLVVSGLPWTLIPAVRQRAILGGASEVLTPEGVFTTFAYVHAMPSGPARRFRRLLEDQFEEVLLGRTIWANLPPALVYHCRRPRVMSHGHSER